MRIVVVLSLFVSYGVAFAIIRQILRLSNSPLADYGLFLPCIGALAIAIGSIWLVETVLKRTWRSGKRIELDDDGLKLKLAVEQGIHLKWQSDFSVFHWTFDLAKNPKIGAGAALA